mgnify:CR=1 FL=1
MMHYDSISFEPQEISKDEFHELYGKDFDEQKAGVSFEAAHCMIDPYYDEICNTTKPLIGSSLEQLKDLYNQAGEEI